MQAAVLAGPRRIRLQETNIPQPAARQVRVRIEGCGICGSNLAPWEGRPWFEYPFAPGGPGHEGWGIVDEIGPEVTKVSTGQRVALLSYQAFAEYDVAEEDCIVPLPEELEGQPFPGEALGCAYNVFRRSDIQAGQQVAVVGVGFLGAILVALAAKSGARVIAISRRKCPLEIAKQFGAQSVIAWDTPSEVGRRVMERTGGRGCERVIEAAGAQATLDLSTEICAERGRLIIAGYHQDGLRQVKMQLWNWRGLDVINAHERDPRVYVEGMRLAAQAVARGDFDPSPLYTHRFGLAEIGNGFAALEARPSGFIKGIITI